MKGERERESEREREREREREIPASATRSLWCQDMLVNIVSNDGHFK